MSFQDVSRRRQHPIFDKHRTQPTSNAKPKHSRRSTNDHEPSRSSERKSFETYEKTRPPTDRRSFDTNRQLTYRSSFDSHEKSRSSRKSLTSRQSRKSNHSRKSVDSRSTRSQKEHSKKDKHPKSTRAPPKELVKKQESTRQLEEQVPEKQPIPAKPLNKELIEDKSQQAPTYSLPKELPLPKKDTNRGVRPRLTTTCPVTSRCLMDDDVSTTSGTIATLPSQALFPDDPSVAPAIRSPQLTQSQTMFAAITTEIVSYHNMVARIESLVNAAGRTPEAQWQSRILIQSAEDADRDILKRIYEFEHSDAPDGDFGGPQSSRTQMAARKLRRDYRRVHGELEKVLEDYQAKQLAEISMLTSTAGEEKNEDFFDRVMREREEEINKIHSSMNQVNAIYKDLAGLVDGQQEQIDHLADQTEESKATTRSGLEHIQHGMLALCGPAEKSEEQGATTDARRNPPKSEGREQDVEGLYGQWSVPFESIGDDVLRFGQKVAGDLQDNVQDTILLASCSPTSYQD